MGTLTTTDIVYATLTKNGRQIASYRISGLTSMPDIISYIRRISALAPGILKLQLRNRSQGWSHTQAISITPSSTPIQLALF